MMGSTSDNELSAQQEEKIKAIFDNALREEVWVSLNEEYEEDQEDQDICNSEELESFNRIIKLNVLTKSMLEYDRSYFSENSIENIEKYKLYFFSYIVHIASSSDIEKFNQMGNEWFKASFSEELFLKRNEYPWYEYHGEIESSASPVIYRKHKIYISDEKLDDDIVNEINAAYRIAVPTQDCVVANRIQTLLKDVQFTSSRVYSVGNGNLINIKGIVNNGIVNNNEFNAIYDVGYHQKQHPSDKRNKYGGAVRSFKSVVPDVVFLSHWDDDHIMGCVYARKELFECPWFAPQITKKNAISAKRLAAYLTVKNKLTIIERNDKARKLVDVTTANSTISFYLGENKKKQTISRENCGGMLIEIKNSRNTNIITESLFCGDVPYEAVKKVIWDARRAGYDNLLVPHHGSYMCCHSLKIKNQAIAVVCSNNSTNRPNSNHKAALEAGGTGYNVQITENSIDSWIDLDLG